MLKFEVDRIEPDGSVSGRNGHVDIPLGTVFTQLKMTRFEQNVWVLEDYPAAIELRLIEVLFYRKSIELIPGGYTAGLRFEGSGLDILANALASKRKGQHLEICA